MASFDTRCGLKIHLYESALQQGSQIETRYCNTAECEAMANPFYFFAMMYKAEHPKFSSPATCYLSMGVGDPCTPLYHMLIIHL